MEAVNLLIIGILSIILFAFGVALFIKIRHEIQAKKEINQEKMKIIKMMGLK